MATWSQISLWFFVFITDRWWASDLPRLNLPSTFLPIRKSWRYATGRSIENRTQTRGMFRRYISSYYIKVKWSRYRPGVAQRVGRGVALLYHDRGTRRGWVVSSTPRPHFIPGKDLVPILQEAGWPPGPVWTGGKSRPQPYIYIYIYIYIYT